MSIVMGVEYQGSYFKGWQCQADAVTAQGVLEQALSKVANEKITVTCAGRTDAGVHATSQVVNFRTNAKRSLEQWRLGVNSFLTNLTEKNTRYDIKVKWVREINDKFSARFSAKYRHYQYLLLANDNYENNNNNRREDYALFADYFVNPNCKLNVAKMHNAAQSLLGENDFSAFRASGCQSKSPMRSMYGISVKRYSDFIVIDVMANAFLYNMVRNIVGALCEVGKNIKPVSWIKEVLDGKTREVDYKTMPPRGLYLVGVGYPDFPEVDRLSYYNKIMLVSDHFPLVHSSRYLKCEVDDKKVIEDI